jgi:hypothetical protein
MRDDTLLGEAIVITVTDMSCIAQYKGTESFSRSPFHFNRPIRFRLCLEQASFGFHMGLKLAVSSQIEYKCSRNENTQFTMSEVLFGQTRSGILALLSGRPDQSFYLRQIARHIGAGPGHHMRVIESLEHTMGTPTKTVHRLLALSKKRNISNYDVAGAVSGQDLEQTRSSASIP